MVNKYAYDQFGNIGGQEETIPQPFKFVGQHGVMTEPNGFYYMKARYYDPNVGRFISEDPTGFDGGDVNLMAYVGNQPINRIDPSGLCGVALGFSAVGLDITAPIYSTNSGWFGPPSFGVSTTLVGLGIKSYLDSGTRDSSNDVMLNVGGFEGSKYMSIGSNVRNGNTRYEANVGAGIGIPFVNVSTSLATFTNALSRNVLEPFAQSISTGIQSIINLISN